MLSSNIVITLPLSVQKSITVRLAQYKAIKIMYNYKFEMVENEK